jgi:peptidoglycan/LPS O-acetylase OafA/YrhL
MKYRSEIDGLRAVAVIPVILFHAGFEFVSGGFVGVDVFFVISGYLITSILLNDLTSGSFSLLAFYERRARRILPALFFVCFCCMPFAFVWMLPSQLEDFSKSLVAVVLFVSNVLFWREEGYFSAAAELKPLLHTWSLAVEEQFYLLFPVFLFLLWRFGLRLISSIIAIFAVLSLSLSEYASIHHPSANFYLAPSRAWELLIGAICAFILHDKKQWSSNFLSALGLVMILVSVFLFDDETPFPSLYTLVPVLGAALIVLFARQGTWTAQLLSLRLPVFIGLISYSAYLWHQPLFAFARLRNLSEPGPALMAGLVVGTFLLAFLTWRFVERPFRTKGSRLAFSRRTILSGSLGISCLIIIIGLSGEAADGLGWRSNGEVTFRELEERVAINHGLNSHCEEKFNASPNCYTSVLPEILLWGDSFAMHLSQGILASGENLAIQQHTKSGCSPVLGIATMRTDQGADWAPGCLDFNRQVMAWLERNETVKIVILASPFSQLLDARILTETGEVIASPTIDTVAKENFSTVDAIRRTGARVVIVSPTPFSGYDTGQCLMRSVFFKADESSCDFVLGAKTQVDDLLREVESNVAVYWLQDDICTNGLCDVMQEGIFIFRDEGHLSKEGSSFLGQTKNWLEAFARLAN